MKTKVILMHRIQTRGKTNVPDEESGRKQNTPILKDNVCCASFDIIRLKRSTWEDRISELCKTWCRGPMILELISSILDKHVDCKEK
ncbi:hypothetical protein NPIL_443451 [Nephila pilipes]|uniref:Uncharacterized protein n=1 Tax=Nephila pilipes TaxID=299642 RepID=A0A8X6MQS3_NEPPI|nr:hypothetical protein NPIL_443451 [Nephila pilipes]